MPNVEAMMPDGSLTTVFGDGGFAIDGGMAMDRYEVVSAVSGIRWNLKTGGHIFAPRRGMPNYTQQSMALISMYMESFTDEQLASVGRKPFKPYPRSRQGKERAMADGEWLIACFNASAVVIETDS